MSHYKSREKMGLDVAKLIPISQPRKKTVGLVISMVTPAVPADLKGASSAVAPLSFENFRSNRDEC